MVAHHNYVHNGYMVAENQKNNKIFLEDICHNF